MSELKFYHSSIQEKFYLKVGHECFICVLDENGNSCGALISSIDINMGRMEEFFDRACSELNSTLDKLTLKVVGAVSYIHTIKLRVKETDFIKCKFVERIEGFEVIYIPSEGTIRVTKAKDVEEETKIVKVLIVDDSKTIRSLLTKVMSKSSRIEIVATAEKPSDVEDLIKEHRPDVITLDIHMPEMNGVELLKIIQPKYNIPTIMITSVSLEEGPLVFEALESGAFDYMQKPKMEELQVVGPILIEKVVEAAKQKRTVQKSPVATISKISKAFDKNCTIVVGSSTGGTTALKDILCSLPNEIPPIVIVQHIPAVFSKAFADRINNLCSFTVKEAEDGEKIVCNTVYIAPGGLQMKLKKRSGDSFIQITDDAPVNRFKPSVDYLFESVTPNAKDENIVALILTGMGRDGARGMKKLHDLGAMTIAQDEASSVVFGMPKAAIEMGGVNAIVDKDQIGDKLIDFSVLINRKSAS